MHYCYPNPGPIPDFKRQWPDEKIVSCPALCSVDLRDGNQALPKPMTVEEKLEYFQILVALGFKEIEVGFPSASQEDYELVRLLIEGSHIPDDVRIGVLTQCREKLIKRTFNSLKGVKKATVHAYIASSDLHIEKVFFSCRDKVIDKAVFYTDLISSLVQKQKGSDIHYQFSPEEFSDSDVDFVIRLCSKVFEAWGRSTSDEPMIINLPATVERVMPNQFADMVEYFCRNFPAREKVVVSVHCHNDQGMAEAATELALLAGADRVEGDLLGNGERPGNVSLITLAGNLHSRGIDTGLKVGSFSEVAKRASKLIGIPIPERAPYVGELVYSSFSGSHQDAIRKGLKELGKEKDGVVLWKAPYLFGRPEDFGRGHKNLIRINSQSGKGGVRYVLEADHGIELPDEIAEEMRDAIQLNADSKKAEISSREVFEVFEKVYLDPEGPFKLERYWPHPDEEDPDNITRGKAIISMDGQKKILYGRGNGPIDAFVQAISGEVDLSFEVSGLKEYSTSKGKDASAIAYVQVKVNGNGLFWGAGLGTSIDQAATHATMAAINRACRAYS